MSDTLKTEGLLLRKEFLAKKKRVEDRLKQNDTESYVYESPIWIAEQQHMKPFVWGHDVSIDNHGMCRWTDVDEVPLQKFKGSTIFNNDMVEVGSQFNIHIKDHSIIASIKYGFRMTETNVARGIYISFPTKIIYDPTVKRKLESTVAGSVDAEETTLVHMPTATNSRVSSCGAVPKKGTDALRLTRNMSEPYDLRDLNTQLLIAVNEGARE